MFSIMNLWSIFLKKKSENFFFDVLWNVTWVRYADKIVHNGFQVILYSFYKNICLYLIELWFALYSAFSGQTVFERWTIGLFNVAFTAFPPIILGLFDRPVSDDIMIAYPALYFSFQKRAFTVAVSFSWFKECVQICPPNLKAFKL